MEEQFVDVLGVDIPHIIIPVRQAAIWRVDRGGGVSNQAQRSGYNPAKELNDRLIAKCRAKCGFNTVTRISILEFVASCAARPYDQSPMSASKNRLANTLASLAS